MSATLSGSRDPGALLTPAGDEALPGHDTDAGGDQPRNGDSTDGRTGLAGDELSAGHDRRRGDDAVDEPVDGLVGVVDPEVDAEGAGPDLLEDRFDLVRQVTDAGGPSCGRTVRRLGGCGGGRTARAASCGRRARATR